MTHPYYTIDFSASACMFEIRVNDYPVITMNVEGQVATSIPVNFAILEKGTQSISVIVMPMVGETKLHQKAELKFDIKLFDVVNDFVFKKQIGEYKMQPIDSKKVVPIINYASSFIADVPYKLDAWQKGTNLKDVKDVNEKLIKAYQNISNLINKGDYNAFSKAIEKREYNMTTSMYLSSAESKARVAELVSDFKNGFKVMPISGKSLVHKYGNGKVAAMKKLNGESALYLFSKETKEELMLDITFYIPEGKTEFEVI